MGKLIRNGIEYGGGNGTDIFEVDQATYDALKQAGTLVHNALYVISDAPNLNETADDIEYSSGVSVATAISGLQPKIYYFIGTTTGNSNLDVSGTTGFDYTKETIVSVCAREASNVSYSVVCTPYTYDVVNHLGYIEGLKCRSATEGRSIASTTIDGYFWTIPRGSRGN